MNSSELKAHTGSDNLDVKEESFIEKVVFINRVNKVTRGGRNLNFAALVVVGDGKGKVGYALGKAAEVAEAIRKGINKAKKYLISIPLGKNTIVHTVEGKFNAVKVILRPASEGTGVIASLPVRSVCEALGIKNVLTKVVGKSNNPINVVKATIEALKNTKV